MAWFELLTGGQRFVVVTEVLARRLQVGDLLGYGLRIIPLNRGSKRVMGHGEGVKRGLELSEQIVVSLLLGC
jgi:hypothetical protein